MRFLDSNVIIYAYSKTPHKMPNEAMLKEASKGIMAEVGLKNGTGATSTVHLGEVANVLGRRGTPMEVAETIKALCASLKIISVDEEEYVLAAEESARRGVEINDCLAHVLMVKHGISEIYSFDSDFDAFHDIKRKQKP